MRPVTLIYRDLVEHGQLTKMKQVISCYEVKFSLEVGNRVGKLTHKNKKGHR
jgi:hypothetical protein